MATKYFTGKGYGVSNILDISGEPLLTWTDPTTGKTLLCADRCAVVQDPTVAAPWTTLNLYTPRLSDQDSSAIKTALGGTSSQNLDHKVPLELGGSNQFANLALEALDPTTGAQPSNPFENGVSGDVVAGNISLLQGWREMAAGKGFTLVEDITVAPNNDFANAAAGLLGVVKGLIPGAASKSLNATLQEQIKEDGDTLNSSQFNIALRERIFTEQVDFTAQQLGITQAQAQKYVTTFTAQYATAKGTDPREVLGALTANEQKIINAAGTSPMVIGIDVTTLSNVAGYLAAASGIAASIGLIAVIIALFTSGPADVAAAIAGVGLSTIASGFGLSITVGVAATAFFVAEVLGGLALAIPMITKQMLDSGSIVPTLQATALQDDIANIKKEGGTTSSTTTPTTVSGGSGTAPFSAPQGNVLVTVVSSGTVGSGAAFTPRPLDIIESPTDLTTAAQNNLAGYFTALPGLLGYAITLESSVIADDGTSVFGATNRVVKGYTKAGAPEYKNVTNKFAVLEIYYVKSAGKRTILDKIVLGPIDETTYQPAKTDLATIVASLQDDFVITAPGTEAMSVAPSTQQLLTGQSQTSASSTSTTQIGSTPLVPTLATGAPSACSAPDLATFYSLQSLSLPSVVARGAIYEQAGLGTASTYTGTSDQNTKLLQFLQSQLGCFVQPSAPAATDASVAPPVISVPAGTSLTPVPTAQQLANRLNPIAVTVTYPTTGLFTNTGDFGSTLYLRNGNNIFELYLLTVPFNSLYGSTIGAGSQANIVDQWLQTTFGINISSLPAYNITDLLGEPGVVFMSLPNSGADAFNGATPTTAVTTFLALGPDTPAGGTSAVIN